MGPRELQVGEPAPWFVCRSAANPQFHFDTVAGRYVVLCFFGSAQDAAGRQVLADALAQPEVFDDGKACFFGVCNDPDDVSSGRARDAVPGIRFFWDFDLAVARKFGAVLEQSDQSDAVVCRRFSLVLDERLRVAAVVPFGDKPEDHIPQVVDILNSLFRSVPAATSGAFAPVLVVPRVFEPELCSRLVHYYESHGGVESGFMREVDGKTVEATDYGHKRRKDREVLDESLRKATVHRIHDRLVSEIHKAFQFQATRIERYIVACYDSSDGGHFQPHRDNTTKGTAHRRFAVSLNLNEGFEGGDLRFPEFGRRTYRAPVGGAVVFSCSLLHEATGIVAGKRYAFLPFLYDEQAAKIRQQNLQYVAASQPGHERQG